MSTSQLPLLSYIAHLPSLQPRHLEFRKEIEERGFPCIISNDLNNGKEYPLCEKITAESINTMRLSTIRNERGNFFIYFIDESHNDSIANIELGIALGCQTPEIILIGEKPRCGFHILEGIVRCYKTWEDFIADYFIH